MAKIVSIINLIPVRSYGVMDTANFGYVMCSRCIMNTWQTVLLLFKSIELYIKVDAYASVIPLSTCSFHMISIPSPSINSRGAIMEP